MMTISNQKKQEIVDLKTKENNIIPLCLALTKQHYEDS